MRWMMTAMAVLCVCGGWVGVQEKESKAAATQTAKGPTLDVIKKLAGDWYEADANGKSTGHLQSSFRVTAAGSAVLETIMPKNEHEMVTLYHMDNGRLMLTHYCAAGNQPRMRASETSTASKVVFDFADATNLPSPKAFHMHDAIFEFPDENHLNATWTHWNEGKDAGKVTFKLVRGDAK